MYARFLLPLAAGALLLVAQPAIAQEDDDYPPDQAVLTVSPSTVEAGGSVVVTGSGYGSGETVDLTVSTTPIAASWFEDNAEQSEPIAIRPVALGTSAYGVRALAADEVVTADDAGAFSTTLTLYEVGQATITATGRESGLSASAVVTVVAAGPELPETGSSSGRLVQVGGLAIGAGTLLLVGSLVWRRRRARANG